jgi:hypothetical protein
MLKYCSIIIRLDNMFRTTIVHHQVITHIIKTFHCHGVKRLSIHILLFSLKGFTVTVKICVMT